MKVAFCIFFALIVGTTMAASGYNTTATASGFYVNAGLTGGLPTVNVGLNDDDLMYTLTFNSLYESFVNDDDDTPVAIADSTLPFANVTWSYGASARGCAADYQCFELSGSDSDRFGSLVFDFRVQNDTDKSHTKFSVSLRNYNWVNTTASLVFDYQLTEGTAANKQVSSKQEVVHTESVFSNSLSRANKGGMRAAMRDWSVKRPVRFEGAFMMASNNTNSTGTTSTTDNENPFVHTKSDDGYFQITPTAQAGTATINVALIQEDEDDGPFQVVYDNFVGNDLFHDPTLGVSTDTDGPDWDDGSWWSSPLAITLIVIAVLLVIALIVAAIAGGVYVYLQKKKKETYEKY